MKFLRIIFVLCPLTLVFLLCSCGGSGGGETVTATTTVLKTLTGNAVVAVLSGSVLDVVVTDTALNLGYTLSAATNVDDVVVNISCPGGQACASSDTVTPVASGSGLADIGSGGSSTNLTDTTASLQVSVTYTGTETIDSCTTNSPFSADPPFTCTMGAPGVSFTRGDLSTAIGTDSTANFSVDVVATDYNPKASNNLSARKYLLTRLTDLYPGQSDSPQKFIVLGTALYFNAWNSAGKSKIFKYDGTSIVQISDIVSGGNDNPLYLTVCNGALYFVSSNRIYKYDGTNITRLTDTAVLNNIMNLTVSGDVLYFSATSPAGTGRLHKYDGTNTIQIDATFNWPGNMVDYDGVLYFTSDNLLYKYVSSTNTISRIVGVNVPANPLVYNGVLYLSARDGSSKTKLFKYTSSDNTFVQISDINPGGDESPSRLIGYDGDLYFVAAYDGNNSKLFKYDGTAVTWISNLNPGGLDDPMDLAVFDGGLYFRARPSGTSFYKLYKYDSAVDTIYQMSNILPGGNDVPSLLTVYNNALYFSGMISGTKSKIFRLE